jgi:hypothetical protein
VRFAKLVGRNDDIRSLDAILAYSDRPEKVGCRESWRGIARNCAETLRNTLRAATSFELCPSALEREQVVEVERQIEREAEIEHAPLVIEPPVIEVPQSTRVAKERQATLFVEAGDAKLPQVDLLDAAPGMPWTAEQQRALEEASATFGSIRVLPFTAREQLLRLARGELVWLVAEDILVPPHAFERLRTAATAGHRPPAAVSAFLDNHHHGDDPGESSIEVDSVGSECLMIFRPVAGDFFATQGRNERLLLDGGIRCRHSSTSSCR